VSLALQRTGETYVLAEGACTAVGLTSAYAAAAVRAGVVRFHEHDVLLGKDGEPIIVASVPLLSDDPVGAERFVRMALHAIRGALAPVQASHVDVTRVPIYIGLPLDRPGRPDDLERRLRAAVHAEFGSQHIETLACGHAAGMQAFERGMDALLGNRAELCIAGGVDSYLDADTLTWLDENDQLHSSENPYGFIPGEAAGFSLLGTRRTAARMGVIPLVRLWCIGSARESSLIKTDAVCLGKGLISAMRGVLELVPDKPQRMYCDLNGETYRADEFGFAMQALAPRLEETDSYVAPADCWGDVGAASGPLFASLFGASLARGYALGPWALLTTSSESGERYAAALTDVPGRGAP
jgi:3-oxoacyl-[acyl-carrier-protein] synthase-1